MERITVICPVYNTLDYLPEMLRSVRKQTLPVDQFLIIDDGSTDGSAAYLDDAAQNWSQLRVIHQENRGQAAARNLGLSYATGDWIAFIDSDDWWGEDFLERLIEQMRKEGTHCCVATMTDHRPQGVISQSWREGQNPYWMSPSVNNKVFRRAAVEGLRFPEGLWYEDLAFFHRVLNRGIQVGYCPEAVYHCNSRSGSTMLNEDAQKNLDILRIFDLLLEDLGEGEKAEIKRRDQYEVLAIDTLLITTINRLAAMRTVEKREVIRKIRAYVQREFPYWKRQLNHPHFTRAQRLIALLNARGWTTSAQILLKTKAALRGLLKH